MDNSRRSNGGLVALVLLAVFCLEAVLLLWPGVLAINGHEVDAIHAATAAIRVAEGARQHIDFVTPLGVLAIQPVAWFVDLGMGAGRAFLAAQLLVAAVLAPMVWYVACGRLPGLAAPVFAAVQVVMVTALVYGGENGTVSISMYYNRWAWAAFFLAVLIILLPRRAGFGSGTWDGIVLGLTLSALALVKATFFVTLAPVVLIWVLMGRNWRVFLSMAVTGVLCAGTATVVFGGPAFWIAYAQDLMFVSGSDVRAAPGKGLAEILAAPGFFAGTLCLLAAIVGLRKAGHMTDGLLTLLLAPGFIYITYQNWGNDPKWLIVLGFLALGWRCTATGTPFGVPARGFFAGLAVACFALSMASLQTMGFSTIRHVGSDLAAHVTIAADPRHGDMLIERARSFDGEAMVDIEVAGVAEAPEKLVFAGITVGGCTQKFGYFGKMVEIADALKASGHGQALIAFVDVNNPLPLIGGFAQIPQDPPWYYGGTVAAEAAEVLVIPKCPVSKVTFKAYVADLQAVADAWSLSDEHRHYWLFTRAR